MIEKIKRWFEIHKILYKGVDVILISSPLNIADAETYLRNNQFVAQHSSPDGCRIYESGFVQVMLMDAGYIKIGMTGKINSKNISLPFDKAELSSFIKYFKTFK